MEQENCEVSTLFTSDEAQPLYEKFFWRTCPLHFWQGRLMKVDLPQSTEYSARSSHQLEGPYLWKALSDIYTEFNKTRPFAIQRDISTWKSFTAYKITDWVQAGASVWLAYPIQSPDAICGYLVAHRTDQGFLIAELGVKNNTRLPFPTCYIRSLALMKKESRLEGVYTFQMSQT